MNNLKLLDCTLRDGGYINNWKWEYQRAKDIIDLLVKAKVDVIEVGFLRDTGDYDPDVTVCNYIEDLNKLLPKDRGGSMFSAMAMRSNYDVSKLSQYSGNGIEMIRITAHDYDIADAMGFATEVKNKGYKLSINPINIMGYNDEQILWILKQVNNIQPYQFSIVDTFGSMKRRDLDRIVSLVDNNLDPNIRVALHLHENMALSCSLAQQFIDKHLNRPISIDGSLFGMGRIPGNLPIELIADYLNDYMGTSYDIDYMMDAIQDHIAPLKGHQEWGYTPAYFLSARFNLHRNYAEHYLKKGDLTHRDINHILARITKDKKTVFDADYADKLYDEYNNNKIDDKTDRNKLKKLLCNKTVLIIAPGHSIVEYKNDILDFINKEYATVISTNFIPHNYNIDFAFFSNNKRFVRLSSDNFKIIATSNISKGKIDYHIDYNSLSGAFDQGCNSLIMLLKLIKDMDVKRVVIAGADGFSDDKENYYSSSISNYKKRGNGFNTAVTSAINNLDIEVEFLTPSLYNITSQ